MYSKQIKITSFVLLALLTWNCSKFLDEDLSGHIPVDAKSITTYSVLESALVGAYKPMGYTWNMGYSTAAVQAVLMGGDDLTTKFQDKEAFRQFDEMHVSNLNDRMEDIWDGAYKSIQGANNVIANYKHVEGVDSLINQVAGEAFFLRAYNYFWIVRLWGYAPLVLASHNYSDSLMNIGSSDYETIYQQIVSDLLSAELLMQNIKPAPGRVNRGSAKALLATVYLNMAGWPMKDPSFYTLAAQKAWEVISNESLYGFKLVPSFADLWDPNIDDNTEEIFSLKFAADEAWNSNAMFGDAARPSEEGGWDDYFAEINFFLNFPEGVRKEVTFQDTIYKDNSAKPWTVFSTGHPYYKKMQGGPESGYQNALTIPLMRLAEVYLVYAEAQVMATGNTTNANALESINKIRRRAHGFPLDTPSDSIDYISITQDSVVQEKAWEFAAEFVRWFDIVRLEMIDEIIAQRHPSEIPIDRPASYSPFMPIPNSETLENPNLK